MKHWQPPAPAYQPLKNLQTRKQALETDIQRERNRLEKQQASQQEPFVIDSIQRMIDYLASELTRLEHAIETCPSSHNLNWNATRHYCNQYKG